MIGIVKPDTPPAILRKRGRETTVANGEKYDAAPDEYFDGTTTFDFKSALYAATSVKNALRKAQHDKCAFCESKVTHISYGDVEHFRPKGGYKQENGDELGRPGYYWLAYVWANLFLSCQLCNQRFKKNLFPLRNPADRARSHHDDIKNEKPLFIDPAAIDPTDHIGFRSEYVYAIDDSELGRTTIKLLKLNREELVEQRREHLSSIRQLKVVRHLLAQLIAIGDPTGELAAQQQENDAEVVRRQGSSMQYSSMVQALFVDADPD